jgi:hypothetical protein
MAEAVTVPEGESAIVGSNPLFRKWKVFVSSTGLGLDGFRQVARDVIEGFKFDGRAPFEPVMMEDFGARDGAAREVCAEYVRGCDVLVGIIGIRYGAHPPEDQTSYTELEFQTAVDCHLSRLMFLLDKEVARRLEGAVPQGEDRADRQVKLRERIGDDRVSDLTVHTEQDFRDKLTRALENWVLEDSFKRQFVDHSAQFKDARRRLLWLGERTGGATLIFGEPGTGKSILVKALLTDVLLQHAYARLVVRTVRLAEGADAVEEVRAYVQSALDDFARQSGRPVAELPPVLITLYLEPDVSLGRNVATETLSALPSLFTWDAPLATVLAETNSRPVMEHLNRELGWTPGTVITVGDYSNVGDALEQMRRDAPDVRNWPEPDTQILAEALGLRPISMSLAAKDIQAQAAGAPRLVAVRLRQQLEAIAHEESPEGKYAVLIRSSVDSLSPEARELLALMTVLHPKPTLFPDEMAIALDLSLDRGDAIIIATAEDESELDDGQREHRDKADELVAELVRRGLLERLPRQGADPDKPLELTLHPANVRAIHDYLPLSEEKSIEGHARAEAFYRARVGQALGGSLSDRFRMENDAWWDDTEEWLYHFGHLAPGQAGITFAVLFLEAYWWWDSYIEWDTCARLLDYASRPRVQAVSPQMPEVTRLLTNLRKTFPRDYEAALAQIYAQLAGDDHIRLAGLRDIAVRGTSAIPILRKLCTCLGLSELDALFADVTPMPSAAPPDHGSSPDNTRLRLLGDICLFLGWSHWYRADLEPEDAAVAAAEACYRRAESYFLELDESWDVAWTRSMLGEVISRQGGDPDQLWDDAAAGGDENCATDLLAYTDRVRADHLRSRGDLDSALAHYGRAVLYALADQVTENPGAGADAWTQALYREVCLQATKMLAEPLLAPGESSMDARLAEARRRLEVMLDEWGGSWTPEPGTLDEALRRASREDVEGSAGAIADAAFPPGPGDADLGRPQARYYQGVDDLIERTRPQPWVKGLSRWAEQRREAAG